MNLLKKVLEKCGIFKSANVTDEIDKQNAIKVLVNIIVMVITVIVIVKIVVLF